MEFSQIAALFVTAAVFASLAKLLKQPLFIGYLFAGILLSWAGLIGNMQLLQEMGHIGVALLLFLLGLEMNLRDISSVGKSAVLTGLGQIVITFSLGYLLSLLMGFSFLPSFYMGLALTFSSTIIAVRLLSDKDDLTSLYGRISIAVLLIQDFFAVVILLFLGGEVSGGLSTPLGYLLTFLKGGLLVFLVWALSKRVLPLVFEKITGHSSELLFIVSISWALGVSAFVYGFLGFNLEIGGFLAGLALSGLPEHLQIANKTKPLRDFFLTVFFLVLGANLVVGGNIVGLIPKALVLSVFVILSHIFVVMAIMGFLGYKRRTSFLVGIMGSQVSEFSLITASVGLSMGHIDNMFLSLISMVGVITMVTSTYLIGSDEKIFERFKKYLRIFERKITKEYALLPEVKISDHVVVVGCDRTGRQIVKYLAKKNVPYLVVDYNPKVYKDLTAQNTPIVFGDINDTEISDIARIYESRLVVLTTSNLNDNLNFLESIKKLEKRPKTIFTSSSKSDGIKLYEKGADFVIVPEMVAGEHIKDLLRHYGTRGERLSDAGKRHFKRLIFV
jgi:Kef-type K+ transport system membrane component KefB